MVSTLMRRPRLDLRDGGGEARLEAVEADQRLRFRNPSILPNLPTLLEREGRLAESAKGSESFLKIPEGPPGVNVVSPAWAPEKGSHPSREKRMRMASTSSLHNEDPRRLHGERVLKRSRDQLGISRVVLTISESSFR